MPLPEDLALRSRNDLLRVIAEQQQQIAELTARVAALQAEVERLKREGQRPAALFSKGTCVATPKKPGRKPGQGPARISVNLRDNRSKIEGGLL